MASGIFPRSFDMRIILLDSTANADPAMPMEMLMSAVTIAAASFIPSPTIAVTPLFCRSAIIFALSSGNNSACTRSRLLFSCIQIVVCQWSTHLLLSQLKVDMLVQPATIQDASKGLKFGKFMVSLDPYKLL
ncbi:hypothetical protein MLD38_027384 [Melastoma candidum]|uniref:Uncharacterized protein n=1 Tax=Melastoma candidum TaxID=119954 RepID=A0ACB9P3E8_9MYRT|nr:hypothetical protein MLD38_027384 [Melastoma candidum]